MLDSEKLMTDSKASTTSTNTAAGEADNPAPRGDSRKVIYAAIVANLGIATAKFIVAGITGSASMVAEGIHSAVDTGNEFLLLLGERRSARAPDRKHPFGYGKSLYFWALIVALPFMLIASFTTRPESFSAFSTSAWIALGYVSLFSMLIGFIFWYKGLALGGIATVGQLQLLQPFFGLGLSAALLHETVDPLMLVSTLGVILCVAGSRKFSG